MNLQSTSKMKCNSRDSDPDAVIILSPPKKLSRSKIKEDIMKKTKPVESKETKKEPEKKGVKSMTCGVKG